MAKLLSRIFNARSALSRIPSSSKNNLFRKPFQRLIRNSLYSTGWSCCCCCFFIDVRAPFGIQSSRSPISLLAPVHLRHFSRRSLCGRNKFESIHLAWNARRFATFRAAFNLRACCLHDCLPWLPFPALSFVLPAAVFVQLNFLFRFQILMELF